MLSDEKEYQKSSHLSHLLSDHLTKNFPMAKLSVLLIHLTILKQELTDTVKDTIIQEGTVSLYANLTQHHA
jgi:hypothetical protein